ncbi:MAG: amidophosphoribosyltransferase [Methanomassiliicoccaceae archaeon]|nr:amidophosphoribosyltransferase [Methanomassiliicoccaceae archaeon]
MTGPKHSCGVVGVCRTADVADDIFKALMIMQHRGQESAGISVFDGKDIVTEKGSGSVREAIKHNAVKSLRGHCGVGHVRYSTAGSKGVMNAQPLTVETGFGTVAIAHNGDITNYAELKERYLMSGVSFLTDSDTELAVRSLTEHMTRRRDPIEAMRSMMKEIEGAYSFTVLINGRLFGIRDPHGIRPLCIGRTGGGHIIASESAAIDALNGTFIRDVAPGEIVEAEHDRLISYPGVSDRRRAHCMFEWVYFARPDSVIDGREVYDIRKSIGKILAREHPADADAVIPIPDSGRAQAIGFSIASGMRYEEGFMKNRFAERTFILPDQRERELAVSMKMNPIKSTVSGRRLVVVDDSVVRGTTLKKLIKMLRGAGAKEVHVRIGCPPVIAPCHYGVDMKSMDQFVAAGRTEEEICRMVGADSLGYISIGGLVEAIGKPEGDLCMACLDGRYPVRIPGGTHLSQMTLENGR